MYCHKHSNDLELFSIDGRTGELKHCSIKKFRSRIPKNILSKFVEVNNGHLVHEELIAGFDRNQVLYEEDILKSLASRAQTLLKELTPSKRGHEELVKLDLDI
jgi:hypothetical protein